MIWRVRRVADRSRRAGPLDLHRRRPGAEREGDAHLPRARAHRPVGNRRARRPATPASADAADRPVHLEPPKNGTIVPHRRVPARLHPAAARRRQRGLQGDRRRPRRRTRSYADPMMHKTARSTTSSSSRARSTRSWKQARRCCAPATCWCSAAPTIPGACAASEPCLVAVGPGQREAAEMKQRRRHRPRHHGLGACRPTWSRTASRSTATTSLAARPRRAEARRRHSSCISRWNSKATMIITSLPSAAALHAVCQAARHGKGDRHRDQHAADRGQGEGARHAEEEGHHPARLPAVGHRRAGEGRRPGGVRQRRQERPFRKQSPS